MKGGGGGGVKKWAKIADGCKCVEVNGVEVGWGTEISGRRKKIIHYILYGSFPSFKFLQISKRASYLLKRLLIKAWKGYHFNQARILKPKKIYKHEHRIKHVIKQVRNNGYLQL